MDAIIDYEKNFDFNNLYFTSPSSMNGGNYFIKIINGSTPLYLQPPKCLLKNGIIKTVKRAYCDLMFNRDDAKFIEWIENLENICQMKIFENRAKWFESDLLKDDIESSFTPPFKLYKSGSFYILRANVPTLLDKINIKIYNENNEEIKITDLKNDESVATILEIQGIKCSTRSFQLEFAVKQLLSINPVNLFDKLLLNKTKINKRDEDCESIKELRTLKTATDEKNTLTDKDNKINLISKDDNVAKDTIVNSESSFIIKTNDNTKSIKDNKINLISKDDNVAKDTIVNSESSFIIKTNDNTKSIKDNKESIFRKNNDNLMEIDIQPRDDDTMFLKSRNDVYYNMYRESLKKARIAKEIALTNYLEAKRIKNTYMLNDSDTEDSDSDNGDLDNIT